MRALDPPRRHLIGSHEFGPPSPLSSSSLPRPRSARRRILGDCARHPRLPAMRMRPPSRIPPPLRRDGASFVLLSPLDSDGLATPLRVAATSVNIAELKRKSVPELHDMAEDYAIENLRRAPEAGSHLPHRAEPARRQRSSLTGEGVLEILPEGYGFLRSQDWNYLYGPDDIYVSPSQIKRFDLRTGDTVSRPGAAAEGVGALSRAAQGRVRQRRRARSRQSSASPSTICGRAIPTGACVSRRRTATSACASWISSRRSARASAV